MKILWIGKLFETFSQDVWTIYFEFSPPENQSKMLFKY